MGKSTLSYCMLRVSDDRPHDSKMYVAWFSFDEQNLDMRSVGNMLRCCAIQVAERDSTYGHELQAGVNCEDLVALD